MTWSNASPVLIQFRAQLLLSPTILAVPMVQAEFHYPAFGPSGTTPETMPACLLQETPQERERYAEGALPLVSGTLKAAFFFGEATSLDSGAMEAFARDVIKDLALQSASGGISFRSFSTSLSSDPKPAARAAGETSAVNLYRSVTITANYGLSR